MGQTGAKVPNFCLNRIKPLVKVRSGSVQSKSSGYSTTNQEGNGEKGGMFNEVVNTGKVIGRKVMILIDSSVESKNALHWALTHTVQSEDSLILLYLKKPSNQVDETKKVLSLRVSEFLSSMIYVCKQKRPEVETKVVVAEGKEKGPAIVEEAKKQGVALLIMGQKKHSMTWRLVMMWAGNRVSGSAGGIVEYCIQNANCMAIAVKRKSKKAGGYLITTKRHKDFWLLA